LDYATKSRYLFPPQDNLKVVFGETGNLVNYVHGNDFTALRPKPSGNLHSPVAMTLVQC
jgi:hypothetical protein